LKGFAPTCRVIEDRSADRAFASTNFLWGFHVCDDFEPRFARPVWWGIREALQLGTYFRVRTICRRTISEFVRSLAGFDVVNGHGASSEATISNLDEKNMNKTKACHGSVIRKFLN
jgi:hypothetical protein